MLKYDILSTGFANQSLFLKVQETYRVKRELQCLRLSEAWIESLECWLVGWLEGIARMIIGIQALNSSTLIYNIKKSIRTDRERISQLLNIQTSHHYLVNISSYKPRLLPQVAILSSFCIHIEFRLYYIQCEDAITPSGCCASSNSTNPMWCRAHPACGRR